MKMLKKLKEKFRKRAAGEPQRQLREETAVLPEKELGRMVFKLTGELNPETGNYICPIPGDLNVVFHEDGTCLGAYNPSRETLIENEKTLTDIARENGFEIELFDWYVNDNQLAKLPVLVDNTLRATLDNYYTACNETVKETIAEKITDLVMNGAPEEDIRKETEESMNNTDMEKEKKDAE